MTLEEKIGQMNQVNTGWRTAKLDDAIGAGKVGSMLNNFDLYEINRLRRIAVEESRLNIPIIMGTDVIYGYRSKRVTFAVPVHELGFHGMDMAYKVEPGKFTVWVGWNAEQGLEGAFEVIV